MKQITDAIECLQSLQSEIDEATKRADELFELRMVKKFLAGSLVRDYGIETSFCPAALKEVPVDELRFHTLIHEYFKARGHCVDKFKKQAMLGGEDES